MDIKTLKEFKDKLFNREKQALAAEWSPTERIFDSSKQDKFGAKYPDLVGIKISDKKGKTYTVSFVYTMYGHNAQEYEDKSHVDILDEKGKCVSSIAASVQETYGPPYGVPYKWKLPYMSGSEPYIGIYKAAFAEMSKYCDECAKDALVVQKTQEAKQKVINAAIAKEVNRFLKSDNLKVEPLSGDEAKDGIAFKGIAVTDGKGKSYRVVFARQKLECHSGDEEWLDMFSDKEVSMSVVDEKGVCLDKIPLQSAKDKLEIRSIAELKANPYAQLYKLALREQDKYMIAQGKSAPKGLLSRFLAKSRNS